MSAGVLEGAAAGVAIIGTLYGLSVPLRRWWRRRGAAAEEHRLDHTGRPARIDPITHQELAPAQPGIAAALQETVTTVRSMRQRQIEIGDALTAIQTHNASQTDQSQKIDQIYDMLHEQKRLAELRHEQTKTAIAETQRGTERFSRDVAELRLTFRNVEDKLMAAVAHLEERVDRMDRRIENRLTEQITTIGEALGPVD